MLDLLLAAHEAGTSWRHLLAPGEARAGFECLSPAGLARRLGRILGLPAEPAETPARLDALDARLRAHDDGARSWSASRARDPHGVARFLLALRDALRLAGWDGRPLDGSARLRDLAELERLPPALPPGLPDVLAELVAAVSAGPLPFPVTVRLADPRRAFPPLVRRLLDALAGAGATVRDAPELAPLAPPSTDLGRVQRALLDPAPPRARLEGDGTLLLLEADTPAEAAEATAAVARTAPLASATFVVAAEPGLLDAALARHGLPTAGVPSASPLRPHLQVLPLRLALAFRPQDPFRAAELLLLPGGPLPGDVRRALLGALDEMPGIGSPAWKEAVEGAATRAEARSREGGAAPAAAAAAAGAVREAVERWFGGELHDPGAGIPATRAAALCAEVADWAGGRVAGATEAGDPVEAAFWSQAAAVARSLERSLLALPPGERVTQRALVQRHGHASGEGSALASFPGEAGRPAIALGPASVAAPADLLLWWGFVKDAGPGPAPEPWTAAEVAALRLSGLSLPEEGERRAIEAQGWRRPLLSARERTVLVRWRLDGAEPVAPHALHDELATRVSKGSLERCAAEAERLLAGGPALPALPPVPSVELPPAGPMAQRPAWKVPPETLEPGELSYTALDQLLGCPFRWALERQALLRPGRGVAIPDGKQLLGDLAHRILQDLLCGEERPAFDALAPEAAKGWAERAFDARVASEAAPLVRLGGEVERARARSLVGDAAGELVRFLRRTGWRPVDRERRVAGRFAGLPASGFVDLVVEKNGVEGLVDLKLSGLRYRREELEQGRGLQLALYASMLRRGGGELPPSGFFVLEDGEMVTVYPQAFPGAYLVDGAPSAEETLRGAEEGFRFWSRVFETGLLPALHEEVAWREEVEEAVDAPIPDDDGTSRRKASCPFCHFARLCVPPVAAPGEGAR